MSDDQHDQSPTKKKHCTRVGAFDREIQMEVVRQAAGYACLISIVDRDTKAPAERADLDLNALDYLIATLERVRGRMHPTGPRQPPPWALEQRGPRWGSQR